jgi:hypothetical protein
MILITVPHAKPEETDNHDQGAIEMIPILSAALRSANVEFELVSGKTNRSLVDLNRREGENTAFMKEVREHLMKAQLHIDLHSFPFTEENVPDEAAITATGGDLRDWSVSDVVLLDVPGVTNVELVASFESELEKCCKVDVISGGYENYLTIVANVLFDVPSVLVELNEGSRPQYVVIAEAIVEAVVLPEIAQPA